MSGWKNIHNVLDDKLKKVQTSMDNELKETSLEDLIKKVKTLA